MNNVIDHVAEATIKLWKKIKNRLLPTPNKFHYVFNLRDVSRIFKGFCQIEKPTVKNCVSLGKSGISSEVFLIGLWRHECERVFVDKLIDNEEKKELMKYIVDGSHENFSDKSKEIGEHLDTK